MKKKTLLLVEGASAEPKFFKNFAKRLCMDVTVFSVKTNIYSLYRLLKKEHFQLDVKAAAATLTHSDKDKSILADKYQCIYLIYDCDAQQTYGNGLRRMITSQREYIRQNFKILEEMVSHFDDEYDETVGKLLLNYPMLESYADANAFFMQEYGETMAAIQAGKLYKRKVSRRVIKAKALQRYVAGDFSDLATQNAYKLSKVVLGKWRFPTYEEAQHILDQKIILSVQRRLAVRMCKMWVLNTSVLLPLMLYKKEVGFFDRLSIPRKNISIAIVLPVGDYVRLTHVQDFLSKLRQQKFSEWECVIVVPMHMWCVFSAISSESGNVKIIMVEDAASSILDCLKMGIKHTVADYVIPCMVPFSPVATALISLAGLIQVYPDCDIATFRRGYNLTRDSSYLEWPNLDKNPACYPVKRQAKAINACESALSKVTLFDSCLKRTLFDGDCESCLIEDYWQRGVSRAEFIVKTNLILFKADLLRIDLLWQYRRYACRLMLCRHGLRRPSSQ